MTAREKAIERQAQIGKEEFGGPGDPDEFREDAVKIVNACAPHIESALLDRIEAAVKRLRDEETSGPDVGDHGTYGTIYGLDAVLATLTELREEGK